jgi:serine/threonine protein kinase
VIRVGLHLAAAIHHVHDQGLVHFDVKPENVVLRDGRPVLMDFGLAAAVGQPAPEGRARGSPPYMAPEQIRRTPAAASMDLFALGAVLYELATSQVCFRPAGDDDFPQLTGRPPRPAELIAGLPPALDNLIWWLLEPAPEDRPGTAAELLTALDRALPPGEERTWPDFVRCHATRAVV